MERRVTNVKENDRYEKFKFKRIIRQLLITILAIALMQVVVSYTRALKFTRFLDINEYDLKILSLTAFTEDQKIKMDFDVKSSEGTPSRPAMDKDFKKDFSLHVSALSNRSISIKDKQKLIEQNRPCYSLFIAVMPRGSSSIEDVKIYELLITEEGNVYFSPQYSGLQISFKYKNGEELFKYIDALYHDTSN